MRATLALIRSSWLSARSYRLRLLGSIASLLLTVVPLYFVANALQPVMADSIAGEGSQYFAFLMLGMVTFLLIPVAVQTLPGEIGSGINSGWLEALLGTRASLPALLAGLMGFGLIWAALRATIMLIGGWVLGASIMWSRAGSAILIMALIVLAYLPIGLIGSAMVIAFRTTGPLPRVVMVVSALLGGVYYPTQVIPSWIQSVSGFVPLTYGLRALRATMLEGLPLADVLPDLGILSVFIVTLSAIGWGALVLALRHARRAGTLTQY